jgi:competence ComEA-like helix-hairpin-helix protein
MRKILTNYFYYSRSERNGLIVLLSVAILFLLIPHIATWFIKEPKAIEFAEYEKMFLAFQNSMNTTNTEGVSANQIKEITLFTFNPNEASFDDFVLLGLPEKIATTIIHYREKGGRFFRKEDMQKIYGLKFEDYQRIEGFIEIGARPNQFGYRSEKDFSKSFSEQNEAPRDIKLFPFDPNKASEMEFLTLGIDKKVVKNLLKFREKNGQFFKKEDLKKIYGFSELDYLRLETYIQISENHRFTQALNNDLTQGGFEPKGKEIKEQSIDVNKATSEELLQLRGIGPTFAARIIQQREKLGGFASLEQIKDTYGLSDSTYRAIVPYLKISTAIFRKVSINKADIQNLNHPYLTRKQAEILIRYRMNHGDFKNVSDVKKTGVFTDATLEKLNPYLIFN